jgi:hypothetical protein
MADSAGAATAFASLAAAFTGRPGVTIPGEGRGFGSSGLRVNGSIFAMLSEERLVLKLPAARVAALIEAGEGVPFDAGKGKPLREWVALSDVGQRSWPGLAEEAYAFVSAGKLRTSNRG